VLVRGAGVSLSQWHRVLLGVINPTNRATLGHNYSFVFFAAAVPVLLVGNCICTLQILPHLFVYLVTVTSVSDSFVCLVTVTSVSDSFVYLVTVTSVSDSFVYLVTVTSVSDSFVYLVTVTSVSDSFVCLVTVTSVSDSFVCLVTVTSVSDSFVYLVTVTSVSDSFVYLFIVTSLFDLLFILLLLKLMFLRCAGDGRPTMFVAVAGRSNGLGPTVSGNTSFPVINCPPLSADWAAQDIWSSLRLPSGQYCMPLSAPYCQTEA